ncbi:Procollagen C-endopeptidase enhancer 1 [Stylophora pistillata]|uniref:Procollagen C-endopeptidase enhancer 1 n=2 Tax=Stylophora pistillata TaxID=50429 RepID=A0A2B4RMV9_STYPI|nr:Procollagen C-endopeptidase enhancer 1 [Stylophora pistillata]
MDVGLVESQSCNKDFTSLSGTVSSPSFSSGSTYENLLDCTYNIQVRSGYRIKLSWSTFDVKGQMPDCVDDSVEIFIGCSLNRHSIGKYCSENGYKPFDVHSPNNCLRLVFKTNVSGVGRGFQASYSSFLLSERQSGVGGQCFSTKTLTATSGVISSPNWPQDYPSNKDCYWKIEVGHNRGIKIAFMDFDLENDLSCEDDKVKVKEGDDHESYNKANTLKESKCGPVNPFYFTSSEERIWIRFKSDTFTSNRGFLAGYVMYDKTPISAKTVGTVIGVLVALAVVIGIAAFVYYKFFHQKRVRERAQRQMAVAHTSAQPQQVTIHPPPAGPQASYAPPPYDQGTGAPYPPQGQPYPPGLTGGDAAYPPGQPGGAPPYPPGQPGGAPPYPPGQPGGAPLYPAGQPGGAPPYPTGQPPYPPQ